MLFRLSIVVLSMLSKQASAFTPISSKHATQKLDSTIVPFQEEQVIHTTKQRNNLLEGIPPPLLPHEDADDMAALAREHLMTNENIQKSFFDENQTLRRLKGMAISSTANAQRLTHASLGVASLTLGACHVLELLQHGFAAPTTPSFTAFSATVYTLCAVAGTTRLEFDKPKERIRNNVIWPVTFTNFWFGASCLTEWAPVFDDCGNMVDTRILFSMFDNPVWQTYTTAIFAITVWQVYEVMQLDQHYENIISGNKSKNTDSPVAFGLADHNSNNAEASLEEFSYNSEGNIVSYTSTDTIATTMSGIRDGL